MYTTIAVEVSSSVLYRERVGGYIVVIRELGGTCTCTYVCVYREGIEKGAGRGVCVAYPLVFSQGSAGLWKECPYSLPVSSWEPEIHMCTSEHSRKCSKTMKEKRGSTSSALRRQLSVFTATCT